MTILNDSAIPTAKKYASPRVVTRLLQWSVPAILAALTGCSSEGAPQELRAATFASFSAAMAAPASAGKTVVLDTEMDVNTLTVAADRTLVVRPGGRLRYSGRLTLDGSVVVTTDQWLERAGDGKINFGPGVEEVRVRWWTGSDSERVAAAFAGGAGRRVVVDRGNYVVDEISSLESDTHVLFEPGAHFERAPGAAEFSNIIDVTGVIGAGVFLSAPAAAGSRTLQVASALDFAPGQLVVVSDDARTFVGENMEVVQVAAVSANTVTLVEELAGSYAAGGRVARFATEKRSIVIENASLSIAPGNAGGGILFNRSYGCTVINPTISGMAHQPGVNFYKSTHGRLVGGYIHDGQHLELGGHGYGYGISASSRDCEATGVVTRNVRENAFSGGARRSVFRANRDYNAFDNSWNSHATGDSDNLIIDNLSVGSRGYGVSIGWDSGNFGDRRISVVGNRIIDAADVGIIADGGLSTPSENAYIGFNEIYDCQATQPAGGRYRIFVANADQPTIQGNMLALGPEVRAGLAVMRSRAAKVVANLIAGPVGSWGLVYGDNVGLEVTGNQMNASGAFLQEGGPSTGVVMSGNLLGSPLLSTPCSDVFMTPQAKQKDAAPSRLQ